MLYGHLLNLNGRGGEGIDFDANLAISTLDFGTAHVSLWQFERLDPSANVLLLHSPTQYVFSDYYRKNLEFDDRTTQISWGQTSNPSAWGVQWIQDHATSQKTANKPVILEEFGVTSDQQATYTAWYNAIISSGLTGDLIW